MFLQKPVLISLSDSSAVINWETNEQCRFRAETFDATGALVAFTENQTFSFNSILYLNNLSPSNNYTVDFLVYDLAKNHNISQEKIQFTTLENYEPIPVKLNKEVESFITDNTAIITWETDKACTGQISLGDEQNMMIYESFQESTPTTDHLIVLNNLIKNSEYFYRISCLDLSGNIVMSDSVKSFMTKSDITEQELLITKEPVSVIDSTNQITITWETNLLSSSFVEYTKTNESSEMITVGKQEQNKLHKVTISNLNNHTEYSFTVYSITIERQKAFKEFSITTQVDNNLIKIPDCRLYNNYPNPFNSSTVIQYELPTFQKVKISVYNYLGQQVQILLDDFMSQGYHSILWNGRNANNQICTSGIYFYKLETSDYVKINKMILLK